MAVLVAAAFCSSRDNFSSNLKFPAIFTPLWRATSLAVLPSIAHVAGLGRHFFSARHAHRVRIRTLRTYLHTNSLNDFRPSVRKPAGNYRHFTLHNRATNRILRATTTHLKKKKRLLIRLLATMKAIEGLYSVVPRSPAVLMPASRQASYSATTKLGKKIISSFFTYERSILPSTWRFLYFRRGLGRGISPAPTPSR